MTTAIEGLAYRPCVGTMVLNSAGQVFVGRRIDREPGQEHWQMPQGGIDEGEDLRAAALRELAEETGITNATILAEHPEWLTYDLPPHLIGIALKGRYRGQTQKWFALRYEGKDKDINLNHHMPPEFDAWRWVEADELPALIVPFKRALYEQIVSAFRHLARPA